MEKLLEAADLKRAAFTVVPEVPELVVPEPEAVLVLPPPLPEPDAVLVVPDDIVVLG
jgi:hypothetical protein